MNRKVVLILVASSALAHAADWTKLRRVAQIASCAASMVDAGTTLRPGLVETNPLLGQGRPNSGRIVGLKIGVCAGQIAYSEWQHARHPQSVSIEKLGAFEATGVAAFFGAMSVRNLRQ